MPISRLQRFDAELLTDRYNHRIIDAWGHDVVKFNEDFVNTPVTTDGIQGWVTTLVEAGANETTLAQADLSGGGILITSDANDNDGLNTQKLGTSFRVDNNSMYFGVRLRMSENTQSDFFAGLSIINTAILDNLPKRIGFRKIDGEAGIRFEAMKTLTTSVSNIHQVVNDTFVTLEFLYDKPAGKLYYYVNGVEYGPVPIDNLPDAGVTPSLHFLAGSATAKTLTVDWIRCFQFGRA